MKTEHNKLVRDKIPIIVAQNGAIAETRILYDDQEYFDELCKKLVEEAKEVTDDPCIHELADALEVLRAIGKRLGYSMEDIEAARRKKAEERGGFDDRVYLISTTE